MKKVLANKNIHLFLLSVTTVAVISGSCNSSTHVQEKVATLKDSIYTPPDTAMLANDEYGEMVRYGRQLIVNTAYYIGPKGKAGQYLGNNMNCGNCHLDAGTRPFGLNFFSSNARYPQYRGREDRILTLAERVNNCIERPHNGTPMPLESKEMKAIVTYIQWLGKDVPKGQHVAGDGALELEYPNRPADLTHGSQIFQMHCASCHGLDGGGLLSIDSTTYTYPPLWGKNSFEASSSMHRVLKMARFIKANMPYKISTWDNPLLADADAIDVAAFINDQDIHPRPYKKRSVASYPNINTKPIDYDEGPYSDTFSIHQHKFGPYQPIIDYHKEHNIPVIF